MYKSHLEMISAMPEADGTEEEEAPAPAQAAPAAKPAEESVTADENKPDPFATSQFSTRVIRGAYESRFSDLQFGDNNGQGTKDSAEA
jgi:hypothetical protein